jgi:hypothetical protein
MDDLRNNENRARFKNDSINTPTPCSADTRAASPGEQPPSIRPDSPLLVGPHDGGRNSHDNMTVKPGMKGGRGAETHRRLYDRSTKYR